MTMITTTMEEDGMTQTAPLALVVVRPKQVYLRQRKRPSARPERSTCHMIIMWCQGQDGGSGGKGVLHRTDK